MSGRHIVIGFSTLGAVQEWMHSYSVIDTHGEDTHSEIAVIVAKTASKRLAMHLADLLNAHPLEDDQP